MEVLPCAAMAAKKPDARNVEAYLSALMVVRKLNLKDVEVHPSALMVLIKINVKNVPVHRPKKHQQKSRYLYFLSII